MKPEKPAPDFPLFAHPNHQWAKKIQGKTIYFGSWSAGWQAALRKYHLMTNGEGTLKRTVERYLESRRLLQASGEITARHLKDIERVLQRLVLVVGGGRVVANIRNWGEWRAELAKTNGPRSLTNHLIKVRACLNWAVREDHLKTFPKSDSLRCPTPGQLRRERATRGARMFEAEEIRKLIAGFMRPFVLLGLNAGLGPTDLVGLSDHHVKDGWLDYSRGKTGVGRRVPLWPETLESLPLPRFTVSTLTRRFTRECKDFDLHVQGRGIYALRHTCQTIGEEAQDHVAVSAILGHVARNTDMASVYRERVSDERLLRVTDHIKNWLWPECVQLFSPGKSTMAGAF